MKRIRILFLPAFTIGTMFFASPARCDVVVHFTAIAGDVLGQSHGDIDLIGLELFSASVPASVKPNEFFTVGPSTITAVDVYQGTLVGPTSFGFGTTTTTATMGAGDIFGLFVAGNISLIVPDGYVSGTALSGTSRYTDQSFSSLGLTPGVYVWTFGENTIELNIGVVPEPSSGFISSIAAVGYGLSRRRRRFCIPH